MSTQCPNEASLTIIGRIALILVLPAWLAACGSGAHVETYDPPPPPPPAETISGQVIKGYIEGAAVFVDTNGNGVPDDGEPRVFTDSEGRYTLPAGQSGVLVALGGVDTATNVPLEGNLFRAPVGSSVLTPFTTLIAELTESGATLAEAETQIRNAFELSLPAGRSLLDFDSVADPAGAEVEDKAEAVMNTVSAVRSILSGAGAADAAGAAVRAVTELARTATTPADLGEAEVVGRVLESAFVAAKLSTSEQEVARVAQAITNVNTQLLAASGANEQAVAATRYAQSQLQDVMTRIGATAAETGGGAIDLARLDADAAEEIDRVIESPEQIISRSQGTTIAQARRLEDRSFPLALRPAVLLIDGRSATVESVQMRFAAAGVMLAKVDTAGGSGQEILEPDATGIHRVAYADLDKVHVLPPPNFNGRLTLEVQVIYASAGAGAAETLHIDIAPVNDAPIARSDFTASVGVDLHGTVSALFAAGFGDGADEMRSFGGSARDTLAGVAIAANAATAAQGVWQYSKDGGPWLDLPTVAATAAVVISAADRVRFQPASGFSASRPGALTAYLIDTSGGTAVSGALVDVSSSLRGGTSRYAATAVSLSSGAVAAVPSPATAAGVGAIVNAARVAGGVSITASLAGLTLSAGDRIELYLNGQPLVPRVTKVLTSADLAAGAVTFAMPAGGLGADGRKEIRTVVTHAGSGVTLLSSPLRLVLDTTPPAPVTLDIGSTVAVDSTEGSTFVVSGNGAQAGSSVELRVSRMGAQPVVHLATADHQGRFAIQMNLSGSGPGTVTIAARALDAAGNASAAVTSQVEIQPAAVLASVVGTAHRDEWIRGTSGPDTFMAGSNAGQDYFIGGAGFDTLLVNGNQADYVFTFVPSAQRAAHQAALGTDTLLQEGIPLVRLARKDAATAEVFFFQAEAVRFADGTVRITPQEIVAGTGASTVNGGAADDRLFAGSTGYGLSTGTGADVLVGGSGADVLIGAGSAGSTFGSTLVGGAGDDLLQIGGTALAARSRVTAYGGAGDDLFQIVPVASVEMAFTLKDLHPGSDRIDLSAFRILRGGVRGTLVLADLNLTALSAALATQGFVEIDLSRFVTASGAALRGTLRIELSQYGFADLTAADFVLAPQ